jgi:serine kinase of HPr protein (carbohydrate metabolism regulator)
MTSPSIHASTVLVGAQAVLIRGPAGSGKSRLTFELLLAAQSGRLAFARLVADDRTHVEAVNGRLLARPPATIAGLLEVRGLGLRRLPYEPVAVVGLVVDLGTPGERLPPADHRQVDIEGITLPRLAVAPGQDALLEVEAALDTAAAYDGSSTVF